MDEKMKQGIIVRQSQLKNSLDYFKMLGAKPTLTELVRIARVLTVFCMDGYNEKTIKLLEDGDNYLQTKFENNES